MDYKAKPVYSDQDNIIATKVNKQDLERDFDGYYDTMLKLLDAQSLAVEHYDDTTAIIYDKDLRKDK
jgi:hypothetical protein